MGNQTERATIDLVINGQQAQATGKELTKTYIDARKALALMAETDPGYSKQRREVEALMKAQQARIVKIHEEKTAWEKFKAGGSSMIAGIAGGNLVSAGITKLLELGPAVVDRQMKIRDSFADIAKAADMSDTEVADLNNQLKKLDTRTATEDLRSIAVVGGQFGIAKKDMEGFVESADKLNVALGDQFESVEKVAETTLTLRNTFQDIKSDNIGEDMMHIGNGLNYLEAQGAATAPVMADFSSRIGGVAIPLGLTSGEVLGLSATLQELNVTAERGSSAMVDILSGITKAPEAFAKYAVGVNGANLSTKEFKNLINSDLNAAFMAVIRGFKEGDTSATGMAAKLADMDIKGNGVMEIFMKLASNTELLTKRQNEGTTALTNMTSVTGEFNKKNHEMAVNLKKIGEWFDGFLENGALGKFADGVLSVTVKLLGLAGASNQATQAYEQQKNKVQDLEKNMPPLLTRIDQLKRKTKLSKDEQQELKKAVNQVAEAIPGAVSQFDNMGRAMSISTGKARELILAQKEILKYNNRQAIDETRKELADLDRKLQAGISRRKQGMTNDEDLAEAGGGFRKMADDELRAQDKENARTLEKRREVVLRLKGLSGEYIETPKPSVKPKQEPNDNFGTAETEAERKAREKAEKAAEKSAERTNKKALIKAESNETQLARMLAEAKERTAKYRDHEQEKEMLQLDEHYKKMYKLAGKNKDEQAKIANAMCEELEAINQKYAEKELKRTYDLNTAKIEQFKENAENNIELEVLAGRMSRDEADKAKLKLEEQSLEASKLLNLAYFKTLEDLYWNDADKLEKIQIDKGAALLKITKGLIANTSQQKEAKREPIDKALNNDLADLEHKHDQELLQLKEKGKKENLTDVELKNAELTIERDFLLKKQKLIEQHYQVLSRMGILSAEEQKNLERAKNQESIQLGEQLLATEQQQYEGRLGKVLKFLDEKQQYMNDAVTIMESLFRVDQNKMDVGPMLDELDKLQHKTNLTSSEQDRMKTIIQQVGKVMPDAVSGTDAYGNAISINTSKAREEVQAQKTRANIIHKVMLAQKAWALASVGISYGEAIMAAVASAKGIPFPGNLLAIAAGIGKATLTNGVAVAKIVGSNIDAPAFAQGGFTDPSDAPSGFTSGATYYPKKNFIAGEKGTEFIMSAPMLRQPVFANLAGALDALQRTGNYKNMSSTNNSSSASANPSNGSTANDTVLNVQLAILKQLEKNQNTMEAYASRPIVNNYRLQEEFADRIGQIRQENKL